VGSDTAAEVQQIARALRLDREFSETGLARLHQNHTHPSGGGARSSSGGRPSNGARPAGGNGRGRSRRPRSRTR
jgi:hypothetical protein